MSNNTCSGGIEHTSLFFEEADEAMAEGRRGEVGKEIGVPEDLHKGWGSEHEASQACMHGDVRKTYALGNQDAEAEKEAWLPNINKGQEIYQNEVVLR